MSNRLASLKLAQIISDPKLDSERESEQRMVAVFLFQHGKWKRFLDLIKANDKKGYGTFEEAAFEMPMAQLEPLWRSYLGSVARNRAQIYRLPLSKVFGRQSEYLAFAQQYGLQGDLGSN